jgi:Divergent InlB B-repeat domain/NHL repeat
MKGPNAARLWLAAICSLAVMLGGGVGVAGGAPSDPRYIFTPVPAPPPAPVLPPPTGSFNGPCGLGVDSNGRIYVSDYYHHAVDIYSSEPTYVTQLANEDPLDGPCGTALDATDRLYVNNYHRNVTRFGASPGFGTGTVLPLPTENPSQHLPTGVAVDTGTGRVYVDNRTYISVYDFMGNPVMEGPEQLRIGDGTLGDGYGVALSLFPGTLGRLYVPDASSNTVKVYDPSVDKVNPIAEIKDPLSNPFISLRDSAIAVDRVTGEVYVADNTNPDHTEQPHAVIHIYGPTGTYKGHLKYKVVDALPPGLAVDNSLSPRFPEVKEGKKGTQGLVYVTTGNTDKAGFYSYPPEAGTFGDPLPPTQSLTVRTSGSGSGAITSQADGIDCSASCQIQALSAEQVSLTATPNPGSEFAGWLGEACSGGDPTCTLTLSESTAVGAHFLTEPSSTQAPQAVPSPLISPSGPMAQKPRAAQGRKRCRKAKATKKRCRRAKHHRIAKRR